MPVRFVENLFICIICLDRTQNRYNRFGSYLAEDGWPDSQVDLAKQLLNEKCGKALPLRRCVKTFYSF